MSEVYPILTQELQVTLRLASVTASARVLERLRQYFEDIQHPRCPGAARPHGKLCEEGQLETRRQSSGPQEELCSPGTGEAGAGGQRGESWLSSSGARLRTAGCSVERRECASSGLCCLPPRPRKDFVSLLPPPRVSGDLFSFLVFFTFPTGAGHWLQPRLRFAGCHCCSGTSKPGAAPSTGGGQEGQGGSPARGDVRALPAGARPRGPHLVDQGRAEAEHEGAHGVEAEPPGQEAPHLRLGQQRRHGGGGV